MSDVAFWGSGSDPALEPFRRALRAEWERRGYEFVEGSDPSAACVFNFVDPDDPKPFRRRQRSTYVIAVHHLAERPENVLRYEYPMLVRALANIAMLVVPGDACYFVTPEQGFYSVPDPGDPEAWVRALFDRIEPLATSRLVIDNHFETDLEPELWDGDEQTEALFQAGRRLDALGLLPAPFPLEDLVTPDDMRWIKLVYGIGGLSYGNLSARKDDRRFWMSASGVDKSSLREVGRDILMVTDYDRAAERMVLSVPPGVEPRRASVDAIEHWMIYREHPAGGRHRPRARVDPGRRGDRVQLPLRHGRAGDGGRRHHPPRAGSGPRRSSGSRTTASRSRARASTTSSTRIEPVIETQIPMIA